MTLLSPVILQVGLSGSADPGSFVFEGLGL